MGNKASSRGDWPSGEGEMARRIREHDWARSGLGPVADWPQSLRTAIDICLDSGFASFVWWGPRLIQFYNDAALAIMQDKHPESFSAPARDAWSDVWPDIGGLAETVMREGRAMIGEDRAMVPDRGGARQNAWFTFSYSPLRDENAAVAGIFITAIETTRRVQAERELREGEEFKNRIIESTADCIKVLDLEGRLQWISRGGQRALELDDFDAVRGMSWFDIWQGPTRERARQAISAAANGTQSRFSGPAPTFKGTLKWWESIITPMLGHDGKPERLLAISRDMSDQRQAIDALVSSERRQRALIEGIPQLVWRAHLPGEWNWSSPQWTAYTGLSREESLGSGWLDAVHEDDRGAVMAAWQKAAASGSFSHEHRIRNGADGRYRWFNTRAAPLYDGQGEIVEWLGTSTDIDDLQRMQDAQKVILAELQHRARNLLAVVRSIAGRTLGRGRKFDEFSGRLAALSRVQGFLARSEGFAVELGEIVRAELDAHGGSGRVRIEGPAIELPGEKAQPFALALHELATNAVKYGALSTPSGRLTVAWHTHEDAKERALVLDWRETGVTLAQRGNGGEERLGYGRELIERALPYQLGAQTHLEFTPQGVECLIRVPLAMLEASKGSSG